MDVVSLGFIAQVKNLAPSSSVSLSHIRDLAGVAAVDGRRSLMFTSGLYSMGGSEFAEKAGIALFRYDAVRGTLTGSNAAARTLRTGGMR